MKLKEYYDNSFRADTALLLNGIPPPEARIVALGMTWMNGCTLLPRISVERRPQFLACLYFTVLVDQAMHTHFLFEHRRFEELTQYPKFRVGLGHPAYLNPALVFEVPIQRGLLDEADVRQIIPDAMRLLVDETVSFFKEHMPHVAAQNFFERLMTDPDVTEHRQPTIVEHDGGTKPVTLRHLIAIELNKAVTNARLRVA